MKRTVAISLLFIFIAGQVNLTWAAHFCGSFEVQSVISLGKADLSCGMEEMSCCDEESRDNSEPKVINDMCCTNDYYSSDADEFFEKAGSSIDKQLTFANSYIISLFSFTQQNDEPQITIDSSPFLIQSDRLVLFQNFLL